MSSWRMRSECNDDRRGNTPSESMFRRIAMVAGERGFTARTTAPRTDQTLGSFSGLSSLNASWRIVM